MASCPVERALILIVVGPMFGTDGVIRTQGRELQRLCQVPFDPTTGLDKTAEGALRIRVAGVNQDAVAALTRVDPFAQGTGGIATVESERGTEKVRERVQQNVV